MTPWYIDIAMQVNTSVFIFAMLTAVFWRRDIPHWQFIFIFGFLGMIGSCFHWIFDSLFLPEFRVPLFIIANGAVGIFIWKLSVRCPSRKSTVTRE